MPEMSGRMRCHLTDRASATGAVPTGARRWSRRGSWKGRQRNPSLLTSARQLQAHVSQRSPVCSISPGLALEKEQQADDCGDDADREDG